MSLQTPTTIRSRPNKLYGKAKATPIGRRRGPAVKSVGKPDALIGHVRFDERGRETERLAKPQAAAPFLDSTLGAEPAVRRGLRPSSAARRRHTGVPPPGLLCAQLAALRGPPAQKSFTD